MIPNYFHRSFMFLILSFVEVASAPSYRGEACQHLDLDLVGLEVKGHFRIRKAQPDRVKRYRKRSIFIVEISFPAI